MKRILALSVFAACELLAQQYTISSFAGGGMAPNSVPASSVRISVSYGIAVSTAGDVYFASGNSIMKVDSKGILTRVAGTGQFGLSTDGGTALDAQLAWPTGIAIDNTGNLYISENAAHRIRKVSPQGIISTVAGTGTSGYSGDGGPAIQAQLNWPVGLALDSSGNLFVADSANQAVRKVSQDGVISTVATGFDLDEGVAVDATGNLYITDYSASTDNCGDIFYSGRVLKASPNGAIATLFAGTQDNPLYTPRGVALDSAGNVYIADSWDQLLKLSQSGAVTTINAGFVEIANVATDASGNVYASDGRGRLVRISVDGNKVNVVGDGVDGNYWGDGSKAADAGLSAPFGLVLDSQGDLYVADSGNNRVRKVAPDGSISTVAGNGTAGFSGDGGPATAAQLAVPSGLALDANGNLYIADRLNNRIRKVSRDGTISTVAGRGDFYPPLGDGGPATSAALAAPLAVAVDAKGNLYIADTSFFLIRKVSPDGIITTVAGSNYYDQGPEDIGLTMGLTVDKSGNLYFAALNTVRRLGSDGTLQTIAGGGTGMAPSGDGAPAINAALLSPVGLALDNSNTLWISGGDLSGFAESGAGYVRAITSDGIIHAVAGNGTVGYSGDGGAATAASFSSSAAGIAVDAAGAIYVADVFNNVVRILRPQPTQ
jgi:sugar lactone lactonase YvrE